MGRFPVSLTTKSNPEAYCTVCNSPSKSIGGIAPQKRSAKNVTKNPDTKKTCSFGIKIGKSNPQDALIHASSIKFTA